MNLRQLLDNIESSNDTAAIESNFDMDTSGKYRCKVCKKQMGSRTEAHEHYAKDHPINAAVGSATPRMPVVREAKKESPRSTGFGMRKPPSTFREERKIGELGQRNNPFGKARLGGPATGGFGIGRSTGIKAPKMPGMGRSGGGGGFHTPKVPMAIKAPKMPSVGRTQGIRAPRSPRMGKI